MNKRGFTLIELLAVIIILGIIMMIAIPNVVGMIDRNRRNTIVEDAKKMINQAEYTLRKNTDIEYPSEGKAIILTLQFLNTADISETPYDTKYSPERSFVAIVNSTENGITEYKYYVHLIACSDLECSKTDSDSVNKRRGINLINEEALNGNNRYELVKQSKDVNVSLGRIIDDRMAYESKIISTIGVSDIEKIFNELE